MFPLLSLISIKFQFKARRAARLTLQADDWWIMAAWVLTLGLSICTWEIGSITGVGVYKIDAATGVVKSFWSLGSPSQLLALGEFYSFSYEPRYQSLVPHPRLNMLAQLVLLEGDPISMSWTGKGRFQLDTVALGFAQSGTSIVLNAAVLLLLIPVLWSLHMRPHKKFGVLLIFWLGAF
ncbi:hypothetical protein AKAW_07293 [Aspergillus luchuensis IFO 4308]|nr:hypothetical protein AKAW_07293 [Aspergillus luchuensis IFO 4308]